ncbi:MAG: ABC transporter permease [Oscillospiraceae bacterium]|jgi:simple sugar transport system permease protein|nr:ABC transporter permease [Oscillospiraceae bacterium]
MTAARGERFLTIRMAQRESMPALQAAALRVLALLLALATGGLFIRLIGFDPLAIYAGMLRGVFGTAISIRETVKLAAPLCVTALGLAVAFRMRYWNIGGEGQMSVGAIAATYFALYHQNLLGVEWPRWLLLTVMALTAMAAGALWGLVPAWFNARYGANETLFTLMLNYVAMYVIQFLREGPWKNPRDMGYPKIAMFPAAAQLPKVLGAHAGWIIALALVVLVSLYIRYTKQGFELTVVGANPNTARYAGMPVRRVILRTAAISAALCALSGMIKASGADRTLTDGVAGGIGFTAITVSWLANLSPPAIAAVAFLFGMLEKGAGYVQSTYRVSASAADVLQGVILFFVLGSEFFTRYRIIIGRTCADERSA